ncbi:MAG: hypothetical protein IIU63_02445 [Clostridia bacterium]|nr:hypothetical protein [Clostridia bacterium]
MRKKHPKIKYIVLLALILFFGLAAVIAIFMASVNNGLPMDNPLIPSESVLVLGLLALALPVLLLALIISVSKKSKKLRRIEAQPDAKLSDRLDGKQDPPKPVKGSGAGVGSGVGSAPGAPERADGESRFFMLAKTDDIMRKYSAPAYDPSVTLSSFCESFQAYAAGNLGLYYDISDIRRFVSNLGVSHILVMQGMSGTGKTSLAYAFGEFIGNASVIVPIQPMWKERTDMIGYYNEFTGKFNETLLLQKMYEANYSRDMYVTVLDEMNIARVEYYFAEFLSLLELPDPEKRYIDVVSDVQKGDPALLKGGRLKLPPNMWFVGTANNDDSTFAISDKVYDRAMVINLDRKTQFFEAAPAKQVRISADQFDAMVARAQKEYGMTARNARRLKKLDAYMIDKFKITFGNRIMKQIRQYIPVYLACGGDELDALDDILSKKVFRKLEAQNPIYVRNSVQGLCSYLDELFGYDRMKLCKEYLRRFERAA